MLRALEDGLMRFEVLFFDELPGEDINEICRVFNEAFFLAGGSFASLLRSRGEWMGRYGIWRRVAAVLGKDHGRIVSTAIITFKNVYLEGELTPAAFIDDVAVLPERQGEGIGKKTLSKALRLCVEEGGELVALYADKLSKAWRMYRRLGFRDEHFVDLMLRVVDGRRLADALGVRGAELALKLLSPLQRRPSGPLDSEALSPDRAEHVFNEIGRTMDLYSKLDRSFFSRTDLIAFNEGAAATASVRLMRGRRKTFKVGLIGTVVYLNPQRVGAVVVSLTEKLESLRVPLILTAVTSTVKMQVRRAGFLPLGGRTTAMILPVRKSVFMRKERIYVPVEHVIGEW